MLVFDLDRDGKLSKFEKRVQTASSEVFRFLMLLVPAWLFIRFAVPISTFVFGEAEMTAVALKMIGVMLIAAFVSHYIRRTLRNYINLREFAAASLKGNAGAGLVFLGISLVDATLFVALAICFV